MNAFLNKGTRGFTLLELMITVAIVAILAGLAYPAYSDYARKARRAEVMEDMLDYANRQEFWRANNTTYGAAGDVAPPTHANYSLAVSNVSATSYTLTATASAAGGQNKDKQSGTSCAVLIITENGRSGSSIPCWSSGASGST